MHIEPLTYIWWMFDVHTWWTFDIHTYWTFEISTIRNSTHIHDEHSAYIHVGEYNHWATRTRYQRWYRVRVAQWLYSPTIHDIHSGIVVFTTLQSKSAPSQMTLHDSNILRSSSMKNIWRTICALADSLILVYSEQNLITMFWGSLLMCAMYRACRRGSMHLCVGLLDWTCHACSWFRHVALMLMLRAPINCSYRCPVGWEKKNSEEVRVLKEPGRHEYWCVCVLR